MPTYEQFGRVVQIVEVRPGVVKIHLSESGVESAFLVRRNGIRDRDSQNVLPRPGVRIMFRRVGGRGGWNSHNVEDGILYGAIGEYGVVEDILFLRRSASVR